MKRLQTFALVACLLGAAYIAGGLIGHLTYTPPPAKPAKKLSSIVRLVDENGATFCTGTVIGANVVLTAAHCISLGAEFGIPLFRSKIGIRPPSNVDFKVVAEVKLARYQMDQALLIGDFSKFQTAPYISDVKTLTGDVLQKNKTACGYPLGGPLFCNSIFYKEPIQFFWKVKGTLIPGMSGGPVLLDDGTVIAINVAVEGDSSIVSPIYNLKSDIEEK